MNQTPAHESANVELMAMIPDGTKHIIDIGCAHGALARVYRAEHPATQVTGIDIDPAYVEAAGQYCTETLSANIEEMGDDAFQELFPSDCWVFGDCLEHLRDPWAVLKRIRGAIDKDGCVLACIPNAQHWSVQWRLLSGNFRYEDSGLLDRTHIRWFTRVTMLEMFAQTGWQVENGVARNISSEHQEQQLAAVRAYAQAAGVDPDIAAQDAAPFQYMFKLVPATLPDQH